MTTPPLIRGGQGRTDAQCRESASALTVLLLLAILGAAALAVL